MIACDDSKRARALRYSRGCTFDTGLILEMEWNADCWIISIVYFKSLNHALKVRRDRQKQDSECVCTRDVHGYVSI